MQAISGRESFIVDKIGYDKEGHKVYTKLGNGTETTYTYDRQRERLQEMNLAAAGAAVMTNKYRYDAVDNILGITNAIDPAKAGGKSQLGGAFSHTYAYDELNRLITASGKAKSASYEMAMTFGRMSEPLTKVQKVDSTRTAQSYDFTYRYEDDSHPTAPTQVGHDHYTYDANGNPILVENDSLNTERRMYWDEDNRLMVLSDNGKTCRYTYNAAGERIVKSHGDLEGVYINGAPQGISFHETEDYTIYPAPIITVTKNRFTKHYFIGSKRIASKIGTGRFSNVYGIGGNNITAGQKDYAARMMQIEKQREEYYKQLGTPPGVPTMKGATADPDNTGIGYNSIITDLGDHSVPEGWIQHPKFNGKGDVPGPPIQWSEPESPDNAQPGYGYIPADTTDTEDIFFYHSDHLGSTSYITDAKANITQFDAYLPYGELLVDEHSSSEEMPYKFNGKQFDEETGLYYYGARYLNPVASIWYGVDPLAEKLPLTSVYSYCMANPIKLVENDGRFPRKWQAQLSRWFYNIFHKTKASEIYENKEAQNPKFRYTYNTFSSPNDKEFVITSNYKFDTEWTKDAQNVGDGMAIGGYAATLTGIGAEVGAPLAAIGNTISALGSGTEIALNLLNGDYGDSFKGIAYGLSEKAIEVGINKLIPGDAGPTTKEVFKYLKGKAFGSGKTKRILNKEFDIGKSIVIQGASLKAKVAEHTIDTAIDKSDNKKNAKR